MGSIAAPSTASALQGVSSGVAQQRKPCARDLVSMSARCGPPRVGLLSPFRSLRLTPPTESSFRLDAGLKGAKGPAFGE